MKTKENCQNCKHWSRNDSSATDDNEDKFGVCNSGKTVYTGGGGHPDETDHILYSDFEGYAAFLETGEDFGCIHFKVKEDNKE